MVERLEKSMFSENLNSKFRIFPEGTDVVLETELVEFTELNMTPRQEQFSIIFRGPLDPVLAQGMHKMEHDKIGTFSLFLVPVRKEEDGIYYEAVFNRLLKNV